jgi:hypothetical protein
MGHVPPTKTHNSKFSGGSVLNKVRKEKSTVMSNPDDLIGQKWEEGSIEEEAADDLIGCPGGFGVPNFSGTEAHPNRFGIQY